MKWRIFILKIILNDIFSDINIINQRMLLISAAYFSSVISYHNTPFFEILIQTRLDHIFLKSMNEFDN